MLRQLPFELDDADIYNELNMQSVPYKDMRLVKNRDSGQSRGFAFVEFNTVEEAQHWMDSTKVHFNIIKQKMKLKFYMDIGNSLTSHDF